MNALSRAFALLLALALPLEAALPRLSNTVARRPLRVAVVGSGPSGLYAAGALLGQPNMAVTVDVFDRRPAPLGLARHGVAPDHQAVKAGAAANLEKVAAHPHFRYFGNVEIGRDLSPADLRRHYDRVIYATGAERERKLGIPGEELQGVHGASAFVGFYNTDTALSGERVDLAVKNAVIIGAGAVALDAARMLARSLAELRSTDLGAPVLDAFAAGRPADIRVVGRQGADGVKAGLKDIEEAASIAGADLVVRRDGLGEARSEIGSYLTRQASRGEGEQDVKIRLHLGAQPVELVGRDGKVAGVKLRNADGSEELVPAELVVRSIGRVAAPIPGLPFDEERGVIPSRDGRVLDPKTGKALPDVYVAGWAKNGARSLIGAQRADAEAVVRSVVQDAVGASLRAEKAKAPAAIVRALEKRGVRYVTHEHWGVIDRLERERGAALGKPREKFATTEEMLAAVAAAPTPRSTQGPLYVVEDGVTRPLGYNPAIPVEPLWRETLGSLLDLPGRVRRVRRYMARVKEHLEEITDEELAWSLMRFEAFENQEGILRRENRELVNDWRPWTGPNLREVMPDDFKGSSLSRISIRKIFKQAMDREEPTRGYQYTSSMNLHNFMPRVAHFMGVTMQERVAAVALTGRAPQVSVWALEEERHGNIMEAVYNLSREPGQPPLVEQGIAPTNPKPGEYSMRSMIANRSLAEIGAASGYLLLKSNARKGSPSDLALEGIFRDEVYHYVLMNAARKWGLGIKGRWARLFQILRHQLDNPLPRALDVVKDERDGFSPLVAFEVAYAFFQIDKRVERYLDTVPDELGERLVGKVYRAEEEARAAVARGEHTWTDPFPMEVNPEMSVEDVDGLERRFPGRFRFENRRLRSSQILEMIANYRKNLDSPSYWLRRKGFGKAGGDGEGLRLSRVVGPEGSRASFELLFPAGGQPRMTVRAEGRELYDGPVAGLSMRRLGAIFAAEDASGLSRWEELAEDLTPKEIVKRFLDDPRYQAAPIPVDDEPAPRPKTEPEASPAREVEAKSSSAQPYKLYMCTTCGYKYDEAKGDPTQGIAPGTRWADVPDTWVCPECDESKAAFAEDMVEVPRS